MTSRTVCSGWAMQTSYLNSEWAYACVSTCWLVLRNSFATALQLISYLYQTVASGSIAGQFSSSDGLRFVGLRFAADSCGYATYGWESQIMSHCAITLFIPWIIDVFSRRANRAQHYIHTRIIVFPDSINPDALPDPWAEAPVWLLVSKHRAHILWGPCMAAAITRAVYVSSSIPRQRQDHAVLHVLFVRAVVWQQHLGYRQGKCCFYLLLPCRRLPKHYQIAVIGRSFQYVHVAYSTIHRSTAPHATALLAAASQHSYLCVRCGPTAITKGYSPTVSFRILLRHLTMPNKLLISTTCLLVTRTSQ
jgi:hypothetical protein